MKYTEHENEQLITIHTRGQIRIQGEQNTGIYKNISVVLKEPQINRIFLGNTDTFHD